MKLERIEIKGFRKCNNIDILLGDASFLIGENNVGKSSILRAIELLLTANTPKPEDYSKFFNDKTNCIENLNTEIVLIGTFSNVPLEADSWVGFKGRVFIENEERKIKYKRHFLRPNLNMKFGNKTRN